MGRAVRQDIEGGWHHVMNRGADRHRIFFTHGDGEYFEGLLEDGCERSGVEVHAYCLMPNHFHMLLHCPKGELSMFMHRIGTRYSRRIRARVGGDGPIFKSRFRSILIDNPQYLAQAGRYIHRNPLELTPSADPVAYRWSSLRCYAGVATAPGWLHTSRASAPATTSRTSLRDARWGASRLSGQFSDWCLAPRVMGLDGRRTAGCLTPSGANFGARHPAL
jgi:REP element-mobilizing transposase RayT